MAFFEGTTSGKLTSRLSSDVNAMVSAIGRPLFVLHSMIASLFVVGFLPCLFARPCLCLSCPSTSTSVRVCLSLLDGCLDPARDLRRFHPVLSADSCPTNALPNKRFLPPLDVPAWPRCSRHASRMIDEYVRAYSSFSCAVGININV